MSRIAPRTAALAAFLFLGVVAPAWSAGDISGVWTLMGYRSTMVPASQRLLKTAEGEAPPLQPWAETLYKKRVAESDAGQPFAGTSAHCLPSGMPLMMMAANYPIQILQTPGQITMLFEEQHLHRMIYMDEKQAEDPDEGYMGHSVGRWEGDTLVVDTVGLTDATTIDLTGMPHSDQLHVVERIRKIDPKTLENLITLEDPKTFTRPWTVRMTYQASSERLREYFCAENNRNTPTEDGHPSFEAQHSSETSK